MMILLVCLEMLRQVFNSGAQQRNLHFRGTRIILMQLEFVDNLAPFFYI